MKEKVLLNDFREYRFLSELEYAPDGKNAALVVSQANKKNGYDSTIWAYRPQQGFVKMTSLGKEKGILWLDNRTSSLPPSGTRTARRPSRRGRS